ncbi:MULTISPECIES: hypothetical protein [Spirosoma]|uniref:Uncharacterized protein n=1 Tax=Spirosoma sordidisoli TaxID=2502893 RepID=A0A4Q2USK2_9BACT|nr:MULTISPECIES: hypothetical protein [Spirosoma]RYC69809.1 hypothetical protein EQG79_14545 [Spirosoma sordidisoli]
MPYFARISSQLRPANQLQHYLLRQVETYNHTLLHDPDSLLAILQKCTDTANYTYRRCSPQTLGVNRDHTTKEIRSISAGGLFAFHLYKVARTLHESAPVSEPTPVPEPEPAPDIVYKRFAIFDGRDSEKISSLQPLDYFTPEVQKLLIADKVWKVYENILGIPFAEEYGGAKQHARP